MAILDRVTFTGADDTTDLTELRLLSSQFPFIEWGILVSAQRQYSPRYPGHAWREHLADLARRGEPMKLAVHLQGRWLRALLAGDGAALREGAGPILDVAQRIQFNFHSGADVLEGAWAAPVNDGQIDGVALYDSSAGAGVVPAEWPKADYWNHPDVPAYSGYAGGLGPDNLELELPRIAAAAGFGTRIWIDMESGVRSVRRGEREHDVFDLEKVRQVIRICAPLIGKEIGA